MFGEYQMGYVTKAEINIWHNKFLGWIKNLRKEVRKEGITFDCRLVGSAKRHLVIRHHNKGFDLDFQIFINKNKNKIKEKDIKRLFINLLNELVVKEGFNYCNDSTSAITIKMVNEKCSFVVVGYDVVILRKKEIDGVENTEILRHYKEANAEEWKFELLPDMKNASKMFRKIKGEKMWQELRRRYYYKKTKINSDKK